MKTHTLLFTMMLGLNTMILSQIPNYVPSNGLLGWWPFSGNANDLSGNGNNGTVKGASLTPNRFGTSNDAYSFNGTSNYISLPNILPTNVGTISFWFQTNSNNPQILVYQSNNGENGFGTATPNAIENHTGLTSTPTNSLGASYMFDNSSGVNYTHSETIALNQWYHMAVAYNTTSAFCYLNGELIYTMNISSETGNNTPANTYIGRPLWAERFLSGKFDDLGVWNRVLTQQEITNLYNDEIGEGVEIKSVKDDSKLVSKSSITILKNNYGSYSEKKIIQVCSNQKYDLNYFASNKFFFETSKVKIIGDIVDDLFNGEGLEQAEFGLSSSPSEINKSGEGVVEKVYNGYYLLSHQQNKSENIEGRVKIYINEKSNEIIAVVFGVKG
ncbi:MAG: LamG domain-containing protein, partial [Crocinitomicaceae bacterium]|nr:LamG domain-containing protein [Crocinitomicaceae bacterium]